VIEKQVKIGINNKVMVEILSGLDENDTVITGFGNDADNTGTTVSPDTAHGHGDAA